MENNETTIADGDKIIGRILKWAVITDIVLLIAVFVMGTYAVSAPAPVPAGDAPRQTAPSATPPKAAPLPKVHEPMSDALGREIDSLPQVGVAPRTPQTPRIEFRAPMQPAPRAAQKTVAPAINSLHAAPRRPSEAAFPRGSARSAAAKIAKRRARSQDIVVITITPETHRSRILAERRSARASIMRRKAARLAALHRAISYRRAGHRPDQDVTLLADKRP